MIQGVKENLMNQQTLKHKGGDDGGLEIFNKIGGGGFGEVFKGKYREVCCLFWAWINDSLLPGQRACVTPHTLTGDVCLRTNHSDIDMCNQTVLPPCSAVQMHIL